MKPVKIAIVGAGAVGSYYGARLAQAGHDVTFLLRSDYSYVTEHGLNIKSIHGDFHLNKVKCEESSQLIGEVDLVVLAWKTTSNMHALEVISPLLNHDTLILTLQNGLGNVEYLGELFGIERILGGLCFVCINRLSSGYIAHTASGKISIAWANSQMDKKLESVKNIFISSGIKCEAVDSLEKALWTKLIWNFPFNGLAISEGGVDTGVLLSKERDLEGVIKSLMREVIDVGRGLGHDIPYTLIDHQITSTRKMGAYKPSSLIDYANGKSVEFDSIWKHPLEVAASLDIATPNMSYLAKKIERRLSRN